MNEPPRKIGNKTLTNADRTNTAWRQGIAARRCVVVVAACLLPLLLGGCASMQQRQASASTYTEQMPGGATTSSSATATDSLSGLGNPYQETEGVVVKVATTVIQGRTGNTGQQVGNDMAYRSTDAADNAIHSAAGYSSMLGGLGSDLAGAIIRGGVKLTEHRMAQKEGIRIVVRIKEGGGYTRYVSVAQPGKLSDFRVGEKVLVDRFEMGQVRVEAL